MSIYDITGTCYLSLKKNPRFKNYHWKINDVNYVLTNENGDKTFDDKIRAINKIQERLTDEFSFDVLNDYSSSLEDNFISQYLNINLSKKTFNTKKITTSSKDYNDVDIVHEKDKLNIPQGMEIVAVDFKQLNMFETLTIIKMLENESIKWVMLHVPVYFDDILKYFNIERKYEVKNHIVYFTQ